MFPGDLYVVKAEIKKMIMMRRRRALCLVCDDIEYYELWDATRKRLREEAMVSFSSSDTLLVIAVEPCHCMCMPTAPTRITFLTKHGIVQEHFYQKGGGFSRGVEACVEKV
jgi:hypothetical protein